MTTRVVEGTATTNVGRAARLSAVLRQQEQVTPLELFFDLVFVLALTQCTAFMADHPGWGGLGRGLLVLAILWWSWVGYAWLTSVVDPEEGAVRLFMFAAMAAFLIAALCVPKAFDDLAVEFCAAYAAVRAAHIGLFVLASRDDRALRRSVTGLAASTAVGVGVLLAGAIMGGDGLVALWALALALDMGGPYLFGAEGWKLVPGHFAERHGLIVIIALGESIVAVGVGAESHMTVGIVAAAVVGIALAAAMWWAYFDVVALVAARRLAARPEGRERNEMARDSYSYLHFPMVAGIVLVALGMKKTLGKVDSELGTVPTFALVGGVAIYLLAHVAVRLRNVRTLNRQRLLVALVLLGFFPVATTLPALAAATLVTALVCGMIAYEAIRFAEGREGVRHRVGAEPPS
jgi:low temperature requirement protein LtrA